MSSQGFALDQPFLAASLGPLRDGNTPLPLGRAVFEIVSTDKTATSNNQNGMAVIGVKIAEGPNAGAQGRMRLNCFRAERNTTVERIAWEHMAKILHVIGLGTTPIPHTSVMHGRKFVGTVVAQSGAEAQEKGYTEIDMNSLEDLNGGKPYAGPGAQAQQAPQQQYQAQPNTQPQGGPGAPGGWPQGGGQPQQAPQQAGGWPGGGAPQQGAPQQGGGGWPGGGGAPAQQQAPQGGGWPQQGAPQGGAPGGWPQQR